MLPKQHKRFIKNGLNRQFTGNVRSNGKDAFPGLISQNVIVFLTAPNPISFTY